MKKNLLFAAIAVMFAVTFSSCEPQELTKTDYLTIEKGWMLTSATSSPSYALSDGSFATDLIKDGYLYDYECDDIIIFNANGTQTINPGANIGDYGYQTEKGATWKFNEDETILHMQIPFFYNEAGDSYDEEQENVEILSLSTNELRVKYTFTDEANPAKGTYSFTLTYVPVK